MVFCFVVLIIHRMFVISNAFMHRMMCLMFHLHSVFLSYPNVYFVCEKKTNVNAYVFTPLTAVQINPLHFLISQLNSHIVIEWIFFFAIFKNFLLRNDNFNSESFIVFTNTLHIYHVGSLRFAIVVSISVSERLKCTILILHVFIVNW